MDCGYLVFPDTPYHTYGYMGLKTFKEQLETDLQYDREISQFSILTKDTHEIRILGTVDFKNVYLFQAKNPNGVLVTAGWQGDEPAGWEACRVLCKEAPECSFIPFVSPYCFISKQHRNHDGQNVDRKWPNPVTPEGKILKNNMHDLLLLGKECLLSLQEDPHRPFSYLYSWNASTNIKSATKQTMSDYFPLLENGIKEPPAQDMFANYFVKSGGKMAIQLETPADGTRTVAMRTACQVDCCKTILALI